MHGNFQNTTAKVMREQKLFQHADVRTFSCFESLTILSRMKLQLIAHQYAKPCGYKQTPRFTSAARKI